MKDGLLIETMRYFNVFDDFIITESFSFKGVSYCSVEQNIFSFSFLKKSILYGNSSIIFLESFFRFFQDLENFEDAKCYYKVYTHSLTLYILRLLEKNGIVKIVSTYRGRDADLSYYYKSIGNSCEHRILKMYNISFCKIRSITIDDMEIITRICKICKIDVDRDLRVKRNDDKLDLYINKRLLFESLVNGELIRRGVEQLENTWSLVRSKDSVLKK